MSDQPLSPFWQVTEGRTVFLNPAPDAAQAVGLGGGYGTTLGPVESFRMQNGEHEKASNPKTLMGNLKVSPLSVVPMTALILEAEAMRYGAYEAPRKDGGKGYGPFNWRDQSVEYLVYADAAMRHIMSAVDREDNDPDSNVAHLAHARATLGILIDAIEHKTVIDNRSKTANGTVARLLRKLKRST